MVSAKTQHPKEALEFLKFLTSADQGGKYVKVTGMTSAVKGSITAQNADAMTLKGLDILNAASGLALWLDTDMDARSTEVKYSEYDSKERSTAMKRLPLKAALRQC